MSHLGVTNQGAHTNVYIAPRAQPKEELLLSQAKPRTKGMVCHWRVTLQIIPLKTISIKKEKDKGRPENI